MEPPPPAKRQRATAPRQLTPAPPADGWLTLVAADDGSRHRVPRVPALSLSDLLTEMLQETEPDDDVGSGEQDVPVPCGQAAALFAAFIQWQQSSGGGGGWGAAGGGTAREPEPPAPAAASVAAAPPALWASRFPDAEWRAAAFFMAPEWQRAVASDWGGALCAAAEAGAQIMGQSALIAWAEDAPLDPKTSPLLATLPAAAVAALLCVVGEKEEDEEDEDDAEDEPDEEDEGCDDKPSVAKWAERELGTAQRQSEGWLVVGGDGKQAKSSTQWQVTLTDKTLGLVLDKAAATPTISRLAEGSNCEKAATAGQRIGAGMQVVRVGDTEVAGMGYAATVRAIKSQTERPLTLTLQEAAAQPQAKHVVVKMGVAAIGESAFGESAMVSVAIPDSVTEIGDAAFYGCSSLKSVAIPDSVTEIGDAAFYGCSSLKSVAIPDSVTKIGDYAFDGCRSLESLAIPNSVTMIGHSAFAGCSYLASIMIPDSVTRIEEETFDGCGWLASVTIPDSVMQIGDAAFSGCLSLASVAIPASVTEIGDAAFYSCRSLASVAIPDSVTRIGRNAFHHCSALPAEHADALRSRYGAHIF